MKRSLMISLVLAVVAGVVAFDVTRRVASKPDERGLDRLQDVTFLTRELGLSAQQASQIKALHAALGAQLNDCCSRHCAARARLAQALASETNGTAQAEAVLAEMCRAYEASERATLQHIRQVRALLSAAQQKEFDALMSRCLCASCSMQGVNAHAPALKERAP
jgi:nickel and cobalt resistance protein CnrR